MKIFKYILFLAIVGLIVFLVLKTYNSPAVPPTTINTKPIDLCFAKFGSANAQGFADRYTLTMSLDGGDVTGELKFLPAEKDSKVGKFEGTVTPVDKVMMARTVNAWWDTFAEGMNTTEELKIIFGEGTASIGFGEMVDRGDGVYVYKDPQNISYSLQLSDVACTDITLRNNIENYLRNNISTLSPVKAFSGGTWYVISVTTDLANNSGIVVYEDGHVQEKRNFSYTANDKQEVQTLKIN